jgi:transcriptional/translational regulatory protein YebC/TACO1
LKDSIQKIIRNGRAFEFRKGRKNERWSAMAKTFTRIGKDIVMAVKEGGPNPDANQFKSGNTKL